MWENDFAAAFKDIHPKAPVHLLVVPKQHVENLDAVKDENFAGKLLMAVREVAHDAGLKGGYEVRLHNGLRAGQEIDHIHFHVLGSKG